MERKVENKNILDKFVESFCGIIEKEKIKYIICSRFVAIAHGRTRGTEDIDMILEKIPLEKFLLLHKKLTENNFESIQSDNPIKLFTDYLLKGISIRYVWANKNYAPPEMEIKLAKDELDEEQLNSRTKLPLTQLNIYFSSVEGNIAFKEQYLKSPKDIEDAKHLRIIYKEELDETEIRRIKKKIIKLREK